MHSVIINGKKFSIEDNAPLKEPLIDAGFRFPCGGYGKCGKCRISCPELPPTELDKRFLSPSQIAEGVRIACDKKVGTSLTIECKMEASAPKIILRECSVSAVITDEEISVSIVGDEIVETVTRKNPLSVYKSFEELINAYSSSPATLTNALRAVIGKESVELFEKYGAAKAGTTAIAAKGVYLKILAGLNIESSFEDVEILSQTDRFGLPTESIYLLPAKGDFIGGEIFAECVKLKERSLLIDCEKTLSLIHIGDEDNVATAIWDCDYSEVALRCLRAAVKFLTKDKPVPAVFLFGSYAYKAEAALENEMLTVYHRDKEPSSTANALLSFRTRSKLLKEADRTSFTTLFENELFQSYFTEE